MFCVKCGTENDDNAYKCIKCGEVLQHVQQFTAGIPGERQVPNYLVQAILVTLFCCLPFGIAAIVFAAQVNGKLSVGDYTGAIELSKKAKLWCWVSFGVGLGFWVIYSILTAIGVMFNI